MSLINTTFLTGIGYWVFGGPWYWVYIGFIKKIFAARLLGIFVHVLLKNSSPN